MRRYAGLCELIKASVSANVVHQACGAKVFESETGALKHRDLVIATPTDMAAADEVAEVGFDVVERDDALSQRLRKVAGDDSIAACIDEDRGPSHDVVIGFAHVGSECADEVDAGAWLKEHALD